MTYILKLRLEKKNKKKWILLKEPNGVRRLSLYSRKRWLAISCWVTQQVDASTFATGYKVSDSSMTTQCYLVCY